VEKYKEALKKDPTQVGAYSKIGNCYVNKSRSEDAIKYWLLATEKDPDTRDVWRSLGYAYKEKRKKTEAIRCFRHYIEKCQSVPSSDCGDIKEIQDEIHDLENEK
jgi:tetratricopeptide (TPR) repeat protein